MRVLNDRKENASESFEVNIPDLLVHAGLTALGIWSVILSPLSMLFSHTRLRQPLPKVTALLGAVIALCVLQMSLLGVVIAFVFGLFVAESIVRENSLWKLVLCSSVLAVSAGFGGVMLSAWLQGMGPLSCWNFLVDGAILNFQRANVLDKNIAWDALKRMLFYEGPFLYLSGAILSLWLSVGIAAHLGWLSEHPRLSGTQLRKLKLPMSFSFLFVSLFILAYVTMNRWQHLLEGMLLVAGSLMFIQGCICLSKILAVRDFQPRLRTFIYSLSILLGFYVLVGIGTLGPWLFRHREREGA